MWEVDVEMAACVAAADAIGGRALIEGRPLGCTGHRGASDAHEFMLSHRLARSLVFVLTKITMVSPNIVSERQRSLNDHHLNIFVSHGTEIIPLGDDQESALRVVNAVFRGESIELGEFTSDLRSVFPRREAKRLSVRILERIKSITCSI